MFVTISIPEIHYSIHYIGEIGIDLIRSTVSHYMDLIYVVFGLYVIKCSRPSFAGNSLAGKDLRLIVSSSLIWCFGSLGVSERCGWRGVDRASVSCLFLPSSFLVRLCLASRGLFLCVRVLPSTYSLVCVLQSLCSSLFAADGVGQERVCVLRLQCGPGTRLCLAASPCRFSFQTGFDDYLDGWSGDCCYQPSRFGRRVKQNESLAQWGGKLVQRLREDHDDHDLGHDKKQRRETYRLRRGFAGRQRTAKKSATHGGMRQRRNKHWNW